MHPDAIEFRTTKYFSEACPLCTEKVGFTAYFCIPDVRDREAEWSMEIDTGPLLQHMDAEHK